MPQRQRGTRLQSMLTSKTVKRYARKAGTNQAINYEGNAASKQAKKSAGNVGINWEGKRSRKVNVTRNLPGMYAEQEQRYLAKWFANKQQWSR